MTIRAPNPLDTDAQAGRYAHEDLVALDVDDLEHELCITIVALGLDEEHDADRGWWLARLRAIRATLRSRR